MVDIWIGGGGGGGGVDAMRLIVKRSSNKSIAIENERNRNLERSMFAFDAGKV